MSKIDQINQTRWKSFTFDCRIDVRTMATLTMFLRKNNMATGSRASVGRLALELFSEVVIAQDPSIEVFDPTEALSILNSFGIKPATRSKKALIKHLASVSINEPLGPNPETIIAERQEAPLDPNAQLIRQVQERMKEKDKDIQCAEKKAFTKRFEEEK